MKKHFDSTIKSEPSKSIGNDIKLMVAINTVWDLKTSAVWAEEARGADESSEKGEEIRIDQEAVVK